MRLDVRLLNFRNGVFRFKNLVGLGKSFFHVSDVNADLRGKILLWIGIREVDVLRLVVDADRTPEGLPRVEKRLQHFVLDLDQAEGFFRDLGRFRRDERDAVAHEADFVVERERVQRPRDRVGLTRGGVDDARDVLPRQNSGDPLHVTRAAGVYPLDAGVRVRRMQDFSVEQSALLEVRREGGLALREFDRVHFDLRLADGLVDVCFGGEDNFWRDKRVACCVLRVVHRRAWKFNRSATEH